MAHTHEIIYQERNSKPFELENESKCVRSGAAGSRGIFKRLCKVWKVIETSSVELGVKVKKFGKPNYKL